MTFNTHIHDTMKLTTTIIAHNTCLQIFHVQLGKLNENGPHTPLPKTYDMHRCVLLIVLKKHSSTISLTYRKDFNLTTSLPFSCYASCQSSEIFVINLPSYTYMRLPNISYTYAVTPIANISPPVISLTLLSWSHIPTYLLSPHRIQNF